MGNAEAPNAPILAGTLDRQLACLPKTAKLTNRAGTHRPQPDSVTSMMYRPYGEFARRLPMR
jgi:hypothetical protein